jgi:hypothetical protein
MVLLTRFPLYMPPPPATPAHELGLAVITAFDLGPATGQAGALAFGTCGKRAHISLYFLFLVNFMYYN